MTSQPWFNAAIGVLVGLPIIWVMYRAFRGMEGAEPNVWRALPSGAGPGFHLVFALRKPLEDQAPAEADFAAVAVTAPNQRAGLFLRAPGRYWLYALPAPGDLTEAEALQAAVKAVREKSPAPVAFENQPVEVRARLLGPPRAA